MATGRKHVPHGHVRLVCDDPHANLVLLLGPEAPQLGAGVGGWEVTNRPRQVGMTTWAGVEPFQLTLGVMLDGLAVRRNVERTLRKLVTVARGDEESPPGVLELYGIAVPADEWVIEGMEFGDPILSGYGNRLRQPLTLTLREYVPPSYLRLRRHALQGARRKTKVVTSRRGDTPAKVARRNHCKWTDLRKLNPKLVKKANQHLHTGTKLRVPVATARHHKHKHR
jgi:hypothetical protein